MKLFVGNLSYDITEGDLQEAFKPFGEVASAAVITDRLSGRSRGFGFVEMPNKAEAQSAINDLNGKELKGRALVVNEARPRAEGQRGGFGRSGGGGGGFNRSGGSGGGFGKGRFNQGGGGKQDRGRRNRAKRESKRFSL